MLLYLSLLGFLLAGILVLFNARQYPSSKYLAVFFILVSLYKLNEYVILYSGSILWNVVISSNFTFMHYLIGPFFYFYIRSVIRQTNRLSNTDYLHFIPAAVFFIALIPYISTSYDYKVEVAKNIVSDSTFLTNFKPTILSEWFSVELVYLSRPVSILSYTFYSLWIFIQFIRKKKSGIFSRQDLLIRNWLIVLFSVLLISFISHWGMISYYFQKDNSISHSAGNLFMQLCSLSFTGLIICPLLFPQILYGIILFDKSDSQKEPRGFSPGKEESSKTLPLVDKEYYNQIGILADDYLAQQKSFLNTGYNLNQLADEMDLPVHHLSYYFREIRQQNFTDYKNELRIRYACELILNEKYKEMTLEAIGEKAGFSSRVTFMRAFKKVTNQTPGNYKISMEQTFREKIE